MTNLLVNVLLASSVQLSCGYALARVSLRERQRGRYLPAKSQSKLTAALDPFPFREPGGAVAQEGRTARRHHAAAPTSPAA